MRFFVPKWQMVEAVLYDGSEESMEKIRVRIPDVNPTSIPLQHYVVFNDNNGPIYVHKDFFESMFYEQKGPLTEPIAKRRMELREMGLTDMQAATVSYHESGMSFAEIADALSIELDKKVSQQTVRAHYVRGKPKILYDFRF